MKGCYRGSYCPSGSVEQLTGFFSSSLYTIGGKAVYSVLKRSINRVPDFDQR